MSSATMFFDVLSKTTKNDQASGIPVQALAEILKYRLAVSQSDSKANAATIQPMIEMYLVSKSLTYWVTTTGGRATIWGLTWKDDNSREFASILTTGIQGSVEQATKASELYKIIWPQ